MGSGIKRPAYTAYEVSDVAEAANLIAAEARAADRTVRRPFSGSTLEGRPTWTAAHSVMWWHVDQERARDRAHDAERDALRARAEAAGQRAEAAEREVAQARAELAQARADARVLAGLLHFDAAPGLAEISVDALTSAIGAAASLPDTEVLAVIRRALGGAA